MASSDGTGITFVEGTDACLYDLANDVINRVVKEVNREGNIFIHALALFAWFTPANSTEVPDVKITMEEGKITQSRMYLANRV